MRGFEQKRLEINLARMKKAGMKFEVVVNPEQAWEFKQGKLLDVKEVLQDIHIYSDAQKGLKVSADDLKKAFGTTEESEVIQKILRDGELQLTSEIRAKFRADKKKKIINLIHQNGIDPRSNLVHPLARIESAIDQAKVRIDEFLSAEEQVGDIVKKIAHVIPIRIEKRTLEVKIPMKHASKCYGTLKSMTTITRDQWQADGSWHGVVELPAGMEADLVDKLNRITHGDLEINKVK